MRKVETALAVDVLLHRREVWRPTSTGRLIQRVMPSSRSHVFSQDIPLAPDTVVRADKTLWILHPAGQSLPTQCDPSELQILLLDGSWREAARMRKTVEPWGRLIRLPEGGPSRYRLRSQHAGHMYSTVEALILLLTALGLGDTAAQLRIQFELHVYAGLRSRGAIHEAADFLRESPLENALPEVMRDLQERRRCSVHIP